MKQHIIMHDQKANQMALAIRDSQEATLALLGKILLLLTVWGSGFLAGIS
ncbi:MAG: hypothetical protein ACU837_09155 [Gammaproteobacteria bacterium]